MLSSLNEHTHAPDATRLEVLRVRNSIKKRALETEETPQQVLGQEMEQLSQAASVQMVPLRHICRTIKKCAKEIDIRIPWTALILKYRMNSKLYASVRTF